MISNKGQINAKRKSTNSAEQKERNSHTALNCSKLINIINNNIFPPPSIFGEERPGALSDAEALLKLMKFANTIGDGVRRILKLCPKPPSIPGERGRIYGPRF